MASPNSDWRAELQSLGKQYFIIHEMIRTGFLSLSQKEIALLREKFAELKNINEQLQKANKELEGVQDIAPIIKEIRKNRIERVRTARALRKLEKEQQEAERKLAIEEKKKNTPYYLGEEYSYLLKFEDPDTTKLQKYELPLIAHVDHLSQYTQLPREKIVWLAYHKAASTIDHYQRFQIPKRKGGFRTIAAPKQDLRKMQQWIYENILLQIPTHKAAMAFKKETSIVQNAALHVGQKTIIRVDIKDFFPSIQFHRVSGLFHQIGYSKGIATVLALLSTESWRISTLVKGKRYFVALSKRYLPQGAITSPALSNLICRHLDRRLTALAQKNGWTYSRYADDIVFSHPEAQIPVENLLKKIDFIVKKEGFEVQKSKTLVMRPHQRQHVTGIVINNGQMRLSQKDIRKFRAFCHQYTLKGKTHMSQKMGKDAEQYARGYWAFMHMVNPEQAQQFKNKYSWL